MTSLPIVYVETTVPSLLAARPSTDVIVAGDQEVTRQWWEHRRGAFRLYVSDFVIEEVSRGDPSAAAKRMDLLEGVPELEIDEETVRLVSRIMDSRVIPARAGADAGHIAVATRYGVDYLLTWNCRHIANAEIVRSLGSVVGDLGYQLPVICTPKELLGGYDDYR